MRTLEGDGSARLADVLVARELCLHLAIDASQVPPKQRAGFVAIAVKRAAPFADPAWDVAWRDGHASVWYWSAGRIEPALSSLAARRVRCFAEARFVGRRHDEGIELLRSGSGLESRIWRQGRLVASRWWAGTPQPVEWSRFLRGAGLDAEAAMPEAGAETIGQFPWDSDRAGSAAGLLGQLSIREWLTIPAVFACLVAGAGVGALSRNGIELLRLRAEVESLTASAGQILDARTEAESTVQGIEALLALRPAARPARLAASLVGALEGQDWTLRNLALEESGQMVATLDLASVDPAALVRTLEGTGEFVDATVEILPNSTQVVLRARAKGGPSGTPIVGEGP